jgi:GTP-binding protein HflX
MDRRRIRTRIKVLRDEIEQVRKRRGQLRERRDKSLVPTVALVGYTNAGKTTLFNRLTRSDAVASDALFVTLDPPVRRVRLPDARDLLVSDTVGFIDRLPHALVAAFRATLEEAADADLLLHVIDASHPDRERMIGAVMRVLESVEALHVPRLEFYNKIDQLPDDDRAALERAVPGRFCISAKTGDGCAALLDAVAAAVALDRQRVTIDLDLDDPADADRLRFLFRHRYRGSPGQAWGAVYETRWDGPVALQVSEVSWSAWVTPARLRAMLAELRFCPDSREILDRIGLDAETSGG